MHSVQKNNLFLAKLPGISAIQMKIIDAITSRLWVIFPEIFPEILNLQKICNPKGELPGCYVYSLMMLRYVIWTLPVSLLGE